MLLVSSLDQDHPPGHWWCPRHRCVRVRLRTFAAHKKNDENVPSSGRPKQPCCAAWMLRKFQQKKHMCIRIRMFLDVFLGIKSHSKEQQTHSKIFYLWMDVPAPEHVSAPSQEVQIGRFFNTPPSKMPLQVYFGFKQICKHWKSQSRFWSFDLAISVISSNSLRWTKKNAEHVCSFHFESRYSIAKHSRPHADHTYPTMANIRQASETWPFVQHHAQNWGRCVQPAVQKAAAEKKRNRNCNWDSYPLWN